MRKIASAQTDYSKELLAWSLPEQEINALCHNIPVLKLKKDLSNLAARRIALAKVERWINKFINAGLLDYNYLVNYDKLADKPVAGYTRDEIITAISFYICYNRFQSGLFLQVVKDGTLEKLVQRLKFLTQY